MKQVIETFKRLYVSETITEEQRLEVLSSVNRLFNAGKITEEERLYILGKEE